MRDETLYFIQQGEDGPIKIGITRHVVDQRIREMQTANPYQLRLLACVPASRHREGRLHAKFGATRLHGEWFLPTKPLMRLITRLRRTTAYWASLLPPALRTDVAHELVAMAPQTLAAQVQCIARKRGLSSTKLAELTGHGHHSYWSRVLAGKLEPGPKVAQRLASALGEELVRVKVFRGPRSSLRPSRKSTKST